MSRPPGGPARAGRALASGLWSGLVDLLWPARCPLCGSWIAAEDAGVRAVAEAHGPLVHLRCLRSLPRAAGAPATPLPLRLGAPVRWAYADAPELFALLHAAKYGGQPRLLVPLARRLGAAARAHAWLPRGAIVVPLPDDPGRLRERGYSPTQLVAAELARATHTLVRTDLLRRTRAAPPQARQHDDLGRRANVASIFAAGRLGEVPREAPLALVDDQVTSGWTAQAALRVLGARGNPVICLALAGSRRAPGELGLDTPERTFLELTRRSRSLSQSGSMT